MPGKRISEEIKKLIVEAKRRKETDRDVAKRFHVDRGTVSRVYKRWREEKTVKCKPVSGRPRKTTERQNRLLIRLAKTDPFKTAVDVQKEARDHLGVAISVWTARRILVRAGLRARIIRVINYLNL